MINYGIACSYAMIGRQLRDAATSADWQALKAGNDNPNLAYSHTLDSLIKAKEATRAFTIALKHTDDCSHIEDWTRERGMLKNRIKDTQKACDRLLAILESRQQDEDYDYCPSYERSMAE